MKYVHVNWIEDVRCEPLIERERGDLHLISSLLQIITQEGEINRVFDCVSAGFDRSNPNSAGNTE